MTKRSYQYLDLIRGLAAIEVLFGHARGLFLVGYEKGAGIYSLLYFGAGFGHQAVMVFFVLSGFFIGRSIHGRWQAGRWNWQDYVANRLSRLWVVLLPALVLTFAWDFIGSHLGVDRSVYEGTDIWHLGLGNVAAHTSLPIFVGNAFFLQNIRVPVFGSNGPLWSLANEFWYYMIYPCLVCTWYRRKSAITAAAWLVAAGSMLWFVGEGIAAGFIVWLGGVLAYRMSQMIVDRKFNLPSAWLWVSLAGFAFALSVARLGIVRDAVGDCLAGAGTIPLVTILAAGRITCPQWLERLSHGLANMSYSLYAVHLPLLVCISAFVVGTGRWHRNIGAVGGLFLICAFAIGYAYIVYWLFESRTDSLRKKLGPRSRLSSAAVAPQRGEAVAVFGPPVP